jgi:hypothetical protein
MSKNLFLLMILIIVAYSSLQAQTYSPQQIKLAERFDSLADNAPREAAYIQTSKDIYETGEDLWFKVYLLNSSNLRPSDLSKTLYLQLVKEDTKKTVWQEKYEIEGGFSNGMILLREDMDEGNYLIEAFTENSFFADSSEFTAIRKVKVVKDITHLRQIKAEFDKKYYDNTDSLKIKLLPVYQKDTSKIDITATLKLSGDVQNVFQTTMKLNEEKELSFIPQSLGKGSQVVINSKYYDHSEEVILPVPCRKNPIQFNVFPEGGTIISGIKSRVAFKAINISGVPVNVNGTLYKNDSIELEFSSMHDGMGSFDFTPVKNAKYYIRLKESLTDSIYSFPQIEPVGLTLRLLSRDKDYLNFLISKNPEDQFENIYLMVQIRGVIYGLTEAKLYKDLKIKVPLADMPQGIAEITLFDDKMIPIAERLVYVNPEKRIRIQTILTDSIFPTRGRVSLKIITRDENNIPVRANLGLTVFDKIYDSQSDSVSILTHLYLSEQLQGRIYNPGYYFNKKNSNCKSALDLLLLTQGWRKYYWNQMNLIKFKEKQQIISDETNGVIFYPNRKRKTPKEQTFVIAFSPNKDSLKIVIPADSVGKFIISTRLLKQWENDFIYIKPYSSFNTELDKGINGPSGTPKYSIHIKLSDSFTTIAEIMRRSKINYPMKDLVHEVVDLSDSYSPLAGIVRIKEVTIKSQKRSPIRGKYLGMLDSLEKYKFNASIDDYVCRYNVLNCPRHVGHPSNTKPLEGRIYYIILYYDTPWEQVIEKHYHFPSVPRYTEEELLVINNLTRIKAYYGNRKFYQPLYDIETDEARIPDFRNTLVWEPSVYTDEKGEATVSFYCSDLYTEFVGRIEGVGGNGLLCTDFFKFKVRKLKFNP